MGRTKPYIFQDLSTIEETDSVSGFLTMELQAMDYHSMSDYQEREKNIQKSVVKWAVLGKLFGLLTLILISVWIGKYHGLDWSTKLMHYHPFFMVLGMVVFYGDAIMVYRVFRGASKKTTKYAHAIMLLGSLLFSSIGLYTVFASQDEHKMDKPLHSAHSWIGIAVFLLFAMQWVCGFVSFLFPQLSLSVRKAYKPLHVFWGAAIFGMAGAACLTGIMDYTGAIANYAELPPEGVIANSAAFSVVAGTVVVLYVLTRPEYVRPPEEESMSLNSTFTSLNGDKGIMNYGN